MHTNSDSESQVEDETLKSEVKEVEDANTQRKLLWNRQSTGISTVLPLGTSCRYLENIQTETCNDSNTGDDFLLGPNKPQTMKNTLYSDNDKRQKDRFRIYKKLPGVVDYGKEYEKLMCTLYALKLIVKGDVEDFEMTTNNKEYGLFDDIGLTVIFKNGIKRTYLFQLKHKDGGKSITSNHLLAENQKSDFGVQKYFKSMVSTKAITKDVVCILSTNSSTYINKSTQISENMNVQVCDDLEYEDLLLNTEERKTSNILRVVQDLDDKNFYFFTEQNNVHKTKMKVEAMLQKLLQCNIFDSFMHFMSEWWSKNFVLSRDDVIAKLTELVVSPYTKILSGNKQNEKTEYLKEAIMNFALTVVETSDEDIIENIWPNENITKDEFNKTKEKFGLKLPEQDKISWFLDKVPLIVKVDDFNKTTIKCAIKLMNKMTATKKIILHGSFRKGEFEEIEGFQNLSDLLNKGKKERHLNMLRSFKVSIQGRESICLEKFINIDREIAEHVRVGELLKMSQTNYIIGSKREELPNLHLSRTVSSTLVKMDKILTIYESQRDETVVILNCDSAFKDKFLRHTTIHCIEISDYFGKKYHKREDIIIFSTKNRCTFAEFTQVCAKSGKSNVYLFQTFDNEFCVLLSKKGNELPSDVIPKSKILPETDILNYFDNPLNAICAPPGMGKSTLMKVLYNNCPSDNWGIYVDLINCNSFLAENPQLEAMCKYFLTIEATQENHIEKEVKNILRRNKKMHLYLDGLDELDSGYVNCVLDFIKEASSNGINVWVSSRENLRETLSHTLYVVPIEIQELSKKQQEEYIHNKLEQKYGKDETAKILNAIFGSVDLNNSQQLLGIPLQLHIITEMFLHNDDAYKSIEEKNIFVLTQMYKLFFDGKIASTLSKVVDEKQTHLLGNIKTLLLEQYECLALKACLNGEDVSKLNVDLKESQDFITAIKQNGDKYGIIKKIINNDEAIFDHQTYAEYFVCVWLTNNKDKMVLLRKEFFSYRYINLRLMFDVMLAEDNPLHLSIIYRNTDRFEKHANDVHRKDQGGRTPLHLICTHGMEYPVYCCLFYDYRPIKINRELNWYTFMITTLVEKQTDVNDKDELFNFACVNYCLEAKCLYPIELFLEKKLLNFSDVKETIFEYYDAATLAYYAAQMGYRNLFSAVISENPQLVHTKIGGECLLETAIIGTEDKNTAVSKKFDVPTNIVNHNNEVLYAFKSVQNYRCIIKLLIDHGFDINAPMNFRKTALQLACEKGDSKIAKILLEFGASVNVIDQDNMNNVLHYASKSVKKNLDILRLLIEKEIDINAQNMSRTTALQIASKKGVYENTEMLLQYGASINIMDKNNENALHHASKSWEDNRNIIKLLIEKGIDVNAQNKKGNTALQLACKKGVYQNTEMLLQYGASINIMDKNIENALHHASKSWEDNRDIIKLLIEKGIDINAQDKNGITGLQLASENCDYEIVEMLLKCGASVNTTDKDNNNVLHYASKSKKDNQDIIKLWIENGIDVNAQNSKEETALQLACANGFYYNAAALLKYVDLINITDKNSMNALHHASKSWDDNRDIIKLLIEKGIDVNAQTLKGKTALLLACKTGVYENTEMLVEYGASVNITDEDNDNALHYASKSWETNQDIIKLLFEKGIDVNAQNIKGMTALQLVRKRCQ